MAAIPARKPTAARPRLTRCLPSPGAEHDLGDHAGPLAELIGLTVSAFVVEKPCLHAPVLFDFTRHDEVGVFESMARANGVSCRIEGYPPGRWVRAPRENAVEHGALAGVGEIEELAELLAVLVVISDAQPFFLGAERHARDAQHHGVFEAQRGFELIVGVGDLVLAHGAATRGDVALGAARTALLEAETIRALPFAFARSLAAWVCTC